MESTLKFDDFLNHSCEPNCYIGWGNLNLIALRDISIGKELTFNYNTSEYDLTSYPNVNEDLSFKCNCGAKSCVGEVKGFRYLSFEQKKKIKKYLSPYLKKKFNEEFKN